MSTQPAVSPTLAQRFGDLALSTDDRQRRCLKMLLLTAALMAVAVALIAYGAARRIFDPHDVRWLALACVLDSTLFYCLMRSGWNQRRADPTLAFPQTIAAQTLIACAYAVTGPVHAATISLLVLVMVFGMFNLGVRATRIAAAYTIALMGAVMLWRSRTDPAVYPPQVELMYFVLVATVMPAVSQLSVLLMTMRSRLKTQKLALENALAHIQEMATRDELTGLVNRRCMMGLLNEHAMRRMRGGPAFYIAMADLDHFKTINDSHGHAAGDEVLRAFAVQAQAVLRNTDIIGRWGGEEFLLLLPETPPGEPTVGAARLRAHLAGTQVCAAVPSLRLAFSAGFARYCEGEPVDQTIERADRALYAAKSAGRNQSIVLDKAVAHPVE